MIAAPGLRTEYPLAIRDKIERLWRMCAFHAPFGTVFQPVFGGGGKTRYTLTLQPDLTTGIDTFLHIADPDANYGNYAYFIVRLTGNRNSLVKFDLTSIPAGYSFVSATLTLTLQATYAGSNQIVTASRILAANSGWTEASNWNYKTPSTVRWAGDVGSNGGSDAGCSVSGTDFSSTPLGTATVIQNAVAGTPYDLALGLVEMGLMISSNDGIILIGNVNTNILFASCEHATETYRPKLIVVYDA